ncbi:ArsR/SmtB family transcription factor [Phytohabitans sp. LJ34]|uniref:ArsR/SmtB family transcription factor n=1 Tax=Phytohabitans sp. LJ34 TaxID=3452217 RepID=UPI003F8C0E64
MLKIYFTSDDVARTRIADGPDPLWELVLALQMLMPQRGDLLFAGWRSEAAGLLRRANLGPRLRLLLALTPNVGYFPDFLNPIDAMRGLEYGLEAIRRTGRETLRRDVGRLASTHRLPAETRDIAEGDPEVMAELTDSMRSCYEILVAPYRRSIESAIERDRAAKTAALAASGVEGMLSRLRPMVAWSLGELRVPSHRDQELHLDGRGLLLIPSYFCVSGPLTLLDPMLPPVLVYPVERQPDALPIRSRSNPAALSALIGTTRAAVLYVISTNPRTTDELARRVGISPATASEHASVLRRAGLITSYRDGHRMRHHPTQLGLALLNQTGDQSTKED